MCIRDSLKALLPDPASLGPRTKGKTNIGCIFTGKKDGKEKTAYIYNVCDHEAVSYTHLDVYKRQVQSVPHPYAAQGDRSPELPVQHRHL